MAQDKITAKQQEILEYIKNTILNKGYPPAVREICEAVHLKSTSSVPPSREPLRFWMTLLILIAERWSISL